MNIILTGSDGFIGKQLLQKLNYLIGYNVHTFGKTTDYKSSHFEKYVKDCDVIIHVGAISDTTLQDPNIMLYYNYECSKQIIKLAHKYGKKLIYSSSAANYGAGNGIPTSIYGWSKKLAEDLGIATNMKFISLRYFNVYGPGEENKGKMASVGYQAWVKKSFKLFPSQPKRDFVYIDDVVNANICALHSNITRGIYDVGTGNAETFEDFLRGMGVEFEYHNESEIPNWYQHFTQANKSKFIPGWEPHYDIKLGTQKYKEYLNE